MLEAGERRAYTANTIVRDPAWRTRDADGALRISPADAAALELASGDTVKLTTPRGSAMVPVEVSETMQPGHISLPNGMGLDDSAGVAPNLLTQTESRDPFVGTPLHKYVPARLERG